LQLFSFGGYGLALAALALVVFGAYDSYPFTPHLSTTAGLKIKIYVASMENQYFSLHIPSERRLLAATYYNPHSGYIFPSRNVLEQH